MTLFDYALAVLVWVLLMWTGYWSLKWVLSFGVAGYGVLGFLSGIFLMRYLFLKGL